MIEWISEKKHGKVKYMQPETEEDVLFLEKYIGEPRPGKPTESLLAAVFVE